MGRRGNITRLGNHYNKEGRNCGARGYLVYCLYVRSKKRAMEKSLPLMGRLGRIFPQSKNTFSKFFQLEFPYFVAPACGGLSHSGL